MTGIDEVVTVTLLKLDKEAIPETWNCLFHFGQQSMFRQHAV
jgi:hypothetical protein